MNKFYDKAFNVGVLFSLLLFTITNLSSYFVAYLSYISHREYLNKLENSGIKMSTSYFGFSRWGFPFYWHETYFSLILGSILNLVFLAIFGFMFGFIFKFAWSKIAPRRVVLK